MIPVTPLRPFTRFLMTIGEIPTSYLISMTYEEQLLWLCNYLEKKVIPAIDNNAEAVKELQDLFVELKSYVDNYFNNLDVQEEINNKLDEMADSGQLADIIAQYLGLAGVLAYDTISDMASATNIDEGSICRTLGETTYNDGKGAFYKVRTLTSQDTIDGVNIVALSVSNTLIAERIHETFINVKLYGAKGDGLTNDSDIIQALIDSNPHSTIFFPDGTYLINQPLKIKTGNTKQVDLFLTPNAIIKTNQQINSLIEIGNDTDESWNRYETGAIVTVKGVTWDCSNTTYGMYLTTYRKQTKIYDCKLMNVSNYGIYVNHTPGFSSDSSDCDFNNISINGVGSESDAIGFYLKGYDNKLTHIRVNRCQIGIYDLSGNMYEDVHILFSNSREITTTEFERTIAWKMSGLGTSCIVNCFADTMATSFEFNSTANIYIKNVISGWYYDVANTNVNVFKVNTGAGLTLAVDGYQINPTTNATIKGLNMDGTNANFRQYITIYETFKFDNIKIANINRLDNKDFIFVRAFYKEDNFNLHDPYTMQMTANSYYPIAYVRNGQYDFNIRMGNDQIINVKLNVVASPTMTITNLVNNGNTNVYSLALCNMTNDTDNVLGGYLCVKANASSKYYNPALISGLHSWNNQFFTHRNYNNNAPLVSPTINVEKTFN